MTEERVLRPLESLSRHQRQGTPEAFARHLLGRVRKAFGTRKVAVLYVMRASIYKSLRGTDCWDEERDARTYPGPCPVVAHPNCGCWGKYVHRCSHSPADGIHAMRQVHLYGGVVEQPEGSSLFREWGTTGKVELVDQSAYGHLARKPTLLYWVLPPLTLGPPPWLFDPIACLKEGGAA